MFWRINWRAFAVGLLVVVAAVWTTFVATRLMTTYSLQTTVSRLEAEVTANTQALRQHTTERDERLDYIERYVYGDLPAQVAAGRTVVITPQWQKNRDQEIRNQIQALQKRLSEQSFLIESFEKNQK